MIGAQMNRGVIKFWLIASLPALLAACTTAPSSRDAPSIRPTASAAGTLAGPELLAGEAPRELERGQASWYSPRLQGRRTASGERYDRDALTAAHKTLPFGTLVRVRSLVLPGREVEVRINDRGPFVAGRVIDLSQAAAEVLGLLTFGVMEVSLAVPESTAQTRMRPHRSGRSHEKNE
ncbi:MAG: septal ring lytic transglycosylase RlpA family protein [Polaromonas sp.]